MNYDAVVPPITLPMQLKAINAFGRAAEKLGLLDVNPDAAHYMQKAVREIGLDDFDFYPIEEPLQQVIDTLRNEANLSLFGRIAAGQMIHRNTMNLLKMQQCFKDKPEIAEVDVESPIIIICTPRTGSTLLHNLINTDANVYVPKMWALHRPCPPPMPEDEFTDDRIKQSDREFGAYYRLVPEMKAIHYFAPEAIEECTHLFANLFSCRLQFSTLTGASNYNEWIFQQDMIPVYEALKKQYQILKYHYQNKILVMKSPAHILSLDALASVWPKARIVHLHRDPATAAGSFCSLTEAVQLSMRQKVDPKAVGKMWQDFWTPALLKSIEWRKKQHMNVFDVNFKSLVKDPVSVVSVIYEHFGLAVPNNIGKNIPAYLREHPKDEYGIHDYSLARYGMDRETLYEQYQHYIQHFNVTLEN